MSDKQYRRRLHPEIADLLAAASFSEMLGSALPEGAKVMMLELDGEGHIDEQIERAMEAAAASHRETCEACREMHAEFGPGTDKKDAAGVPDLATMELNKLNARFKTEVQALEKKHAAEREELARSFEPKTKAPPSNRNIGFMAFVGERPVLGSFEQDVEILRHKLHDKQIVAGKGDSIEIKPVFAQF